MKPLNVVQKELSNEKETQKPYKKLIFHSIAALFCITAIISLVFGVKGYSMYREAVKAYPISPNGIINPK